MRIRLLLLVFCALPTLLLGQARKIIDLRACDLAYEAKNKIAYWEDTAHVTFAQARERMAGIVACLPTHQANFRQNDNPYWFRFEVQPMQTSDGWVLDITYPALDYVDFYYQDEQGRWQKETSGDKIFFEARTIKVKTNAFRLPFHRKGAHTFYVRVQTKGFLRVPFNFVRTDNFYVQALEEDAFLGILYGVVLALMLYNLFLFAVLRDTAYGWYSLYMASFVFLTASLIGHTHQYIFFRNPYWVEPVLVLSGAVGTFALCTFVQGFMQTRQYMPYLHYILFVLKWSAIGNVFVTVVSYSIAALFLNVLASGAAVLVLVAALYGMYKRITAAEYLALAFLSAMIGSLIYSLTLAGYLPYSLLSVHAFRVGTGAQGILFSLALADRYRRMRKKILLHEMEENEKLERMVGERTEELRQLHQELITQNEELQQTQEEILAQRDAIEQKNHELATQNEQIQSSIHAAKAIQKAIVPHQQKREEILKDYFVIYRPRDVVSGDFYWLNKIENNTFVAVVDCTGHGVPGAFMTMIAHNLLEKIVRLWDMYSPAQVLNQMHEEIAIMLRQKETENSYGMDMCFLTITPQGEDAHKVLFASAKQNAYYLQAGKQEIHTLLGARRGIGGMQREDLLFEDTELVLAKDSIIYLTTDGYLDQNDVRRKRIGEKHFVELLRKIYHQDMFTQKQYLIKHIYTHMQDTFQRDDVLVLGFKLP